MKKKRVYHFHNGGGGGVLSVIRNLIEYSVIEEIENHVIYTLNTERFKSFVIPGLRGAVTEQVFYYSPKWNFYYTCKQLSKLLVDEKALIIAHDWLELGMASHLGLQNPLVFFLHGDYDYYYNLAIAHEVTIDKFVPVANSIETKLKKKIRRDNDVCYLRFPVAEAADIKRQIKAINIVFIGRLTEGKGYHLLPEIANELRERDIDVVWHIVGASEASTPKIVTWDINIRVNFYGNISNDRVRSLLGSCDFIILPSIAEGMPVTVVEAMKSGVIPLVNDIDGGIQELIIDDITGYKIRQNNIKSYVEKIVALSENHGLVEKLRFNCIQVANELFDPAKNTELIEKLFIKTSQVKRTKRSHSVYGSRLDKRWLPNILVRFVRTIGSKKPILC